MADDAEKTEPATPKRRREAREEGDVAQSRELATAFLLLVALVALASSVGARVAVSVVRHARGYWSGDALHPGSLGDFHALWVFEMREVGVALLPFAALLMAAGIAVNLAQVGPLFTVKALRPRFSRLNPLQGLKRLVRPEQWVELAKAAAKILFLGATAWWVIEPVAELVLGLSSSTVEEGVLAAGLLARRLAVFAVAGLAVLAAGDLLWVRYRYEKKLRMTRQQVRDELRQREGDPKVKGRIRQVQQELSRQRMIAETARADVVITNPTHYAVALRYERQRMLAPKVVASGRGYVALRIRRVAEEAGVPIVENPPLARTLYRTTKVGRTIPENLYQAVAEVLAYVYGLRRGGGGRAAWL